MALWQLDETQDPSTFPPGLGAAGAPFECKGFYWRLDILNGLPVLVTHVSQKVQFILVLLGSSQYTADKTSLLATVDLPDSIVFEAGTSHLPGPFVKCCGKGRTLSEKMQSMQLHKLRRSMVLKEDRSMEPGFPRVVVQLTNAMGPPTKHLSGAECYEAWQPSDQCWNPTLQPQQFLKEYFASMLKSDSQEWMIRIWWRKNFTTKPSNHGWLPQKSQKGSAQKRSVTDICFAASLSVNSTVDKSHLHLVFHGFLVCQQYC